MAYVCAIIAINITDIKEEKMKNYKVVVSDLDGTLLDDDKNISKENAEAIRKMMDMGIDFVASSGRCLSEMPEEVMNNPYIKYVSCSDGSVIYEKSTLLPVVTSYIPEKTVHQCVEILKDYEILPMVHKAGEVYLDEGKHSHETYVYNNVTPAFENLINIKGEFLPDCLLDAKESGEVELFCVFFHSYSELLECTERLRALGEVSIAASDKNNIEVYYKKAGKGNALVSLAKMLKRDISEVIAVGDSKNDIEMIEAAGLGLAMANSMPELISVADEEICSNEEHSAKYILENYIK